jgi:hypothetical protein
MAIRVCPLAFHPEDLLAHDFYNRMLEMQAILVAFLEEFEFSPAPGNPEIIRSATAIMSPMYVLFLALLSRKVCLTSSSSACRIKGQPGRAQLPLTIRPLR